MQKNYGLAYDSLILLIILALINYMTRLWPLLLLTILGIFIVTIRLAFLSVKKDNKFTEPPISLSPPETEKTLLLKVFSLLQCKITEEIKNKYPDAQWIWERPDAFYAFVNNEPINVILSKAGGYRKARVEVQSLIFHSLIYETAPIITVPNSEDVEVDNNEDSSNIDGTQIANTDYSLLAFEWVESQLLQLNCKCNEAIANGNSEVWLSSEELPIFDSWQEICAVLQQNGFTEANIFSDGIQLRI